jgi:preprotein translocase subunit SecD
MRGLRFGIDILGGSRIMLRLDASHVTIELAPDNVDAAYTGIRAAFEETLHTTVKTIGYDAVTRMVTVEIGLPVTRELVENVIGGHGTVIDIKEVVSDATREEVMHSLDMRVNPYGMPGILFLPVGANFVLFEIAGVEPERAKELLGHQGRLEIFIENELVLTGGDITFVSPVEFDFAAGSWVVPFGISAEGAEKWAAASAGKVDYPTGIYLDRPFDAVVVFSRQVLDEAGVRYDNNARMIYIEWLIHGIPHRFYFQVTAVVVQENLPLPPETLEFLREQRGIKTRIILVGEEDDFKDVITAIENLNYPSLEFAPRGREWAPCEWVERACGLRSMPSITGAVAGQRLTRMVITIGGGATEEARKDGEDLKAVLAQRLPVRISYESETGIDPHLGAGFLREAILVGLVGLAGVGMLIFLRYKHLKISVALTGTMIFEVIIPLGIAAMFGWVIGIPELGGLVLIIGTGIDHEIIITDEMMRGEIQQAKHVSLKGRRRRALTVIFTAAATTIAVMLMLLWLGFGVMRGLALITIVGTLISVLVTRPVYARIVDAILTKEKSMPTP